MLIHPIPGDTKHVAYQNDLDILLVIHCPNCLQGRLKSVADFLRVRWQGSYGEKSAQLIGFPSIFKFCMPIV